MYRARIAAPVLCVTYYSCELREDFYAFMNKV